MDPKRPRVARPSAAPPAVAAAHTVIESFVVPGECRARVEGGKERVEGGRRGRDARLARPRRGRLHSHRAARARASVGCVRTTGGGAAKKKGQNKGPHPLPSSPVPGLNLTDHAFRVPLDHAVGPSGGMIDLFAREAVAAARAGPAPRDAPTLLYLQGGPGFESPRPTDAATWLKAATAHFRVVLLDQRGTGRSSPVTPASLAAAAGASPDAAAAYLAHFRADSIVHDAEIVRAALCGARGAAAPPARWSVLGQSFGGFCATTYLSLAPDGLTEVLLAGGVPPDAAAANTADAVYAALFDRVALQNAKFYARFPGDVARVRSIVAALAATPGGVELPSGGVLTPRGFQLLGLAGLGSGGGFDRLHYLIERALEPTEGSGNGGTAPPPAFTRFFLKSYESWMSWDTNPLYALLHEAIYANGPRAGATAWAAQRARDARGGEFDAAARLAVPGAPIPFTGEMVFPWMFDEVAALRPFKRVAHALAEKDDWGPLYDAAALSSSRVPVAAASYWEDMYVDFGLAQKTLGLMGLAGGGGAGGGGANGARAPAPPPTASTTVRQWVTNEYVHSGIRDDGGRVFDTLMALVRGGTPPF